MREDVPATSVLMPVLDTYKDAAATLVGCHANGIQRESCELDVLLITNEVRPSTSLRSGEVFVDLYFVSEKEALNPTDPEIAVALAHSRPIRDSNLIVSTSTAANQAMLDSSLNRSAQLRLTSCVKALGRSDESASRGDRRVADYWLLSASYEFVFSWLYAQGVVPSPSHLFSQAKQHIKGGPKDFEAFSKGAILNKASRRECSARLEGLSLLYDLVGTRRQAGSVEGTSGSELSFQIVKKKVGQLATLMEHAESYSYQGMEITRLLYHISYSRDTQADLIPGLTPMTAILEQRGGGLLGESLVRDLGLSRQIQEIKDTSSTLRDRVSKLARRI